LVGGFDKVYEIGRNYRNEGISTRHNPEFTMMEYYEAYGNFNTLIVRTQNLLQHVYNYCWHNLPNYAKQFFLDSKKDFPFTLNQFKIIPMWDAIIRGAGKAELLFNPNIHPLVHEYRPNNQPDINVLNPNNERLAKIDVKRLVYDLIDAPTVGQKIGVLFEYLAEPFLTEDYRTDDGLHSLPVFITQYPKEISPLARSFDNAPTLTERFELFVEGRELCNAFQELNDPVDQAERFKDQLACNNKDPMDFDEDYVQALEYGMPPAIGFGIGIDRLVMLLTNRQTIKDVILFPTLKAEKSE
jgi:lysyl-tRNA synthetase class 2